MRRLVRHSAAVLIAIVATATAAAANPQSETLRERASTELYDLDRERAIATYRDALKADPTDAAAQRGLAGALWIEESFRRGTMTVDSYLGGVSRSNVKLPPPPAALLTEFETLTGHAIDAARKKIAANPRDPDAYYELGAAVGLRHVEELPVLAVEPCEPRVVLWRSRCGARVRDRAAERHAADERERREGADREGPAQHGQAGELGHRYSGVGGLVATRRCDVQRRSTTAGATRAR